MKKSNRISNILLVIAIIIIIVLTYFLINNYKTVQSLRNGTGLQAMETNGSNSYITTKQHLSETEALNTQISSLNSQISSLNSTISSLRSQISNLGLTYVDYSSSSVGFSGSATKKFAAYNGSGMYASPAWSYIDFNPGLSSDYVIAGAYVSWTESTSDWAGDYVTFAMKKDSTGSFQAVCGSRIHTTAASGRYFYVGTTGNLGYADITWDAVACVSNSRCFLPVSDTLTGSSERINEVRLIVFKK